jgi:two-component system, NarL family, response regulator NreC
MTDRLAVILVEGSFIVRAGIEQLLQEFSELEVVEVFDGSEKNLADKILSNRADLVILNPETVNDDLVSLTNRLTESGISLVGLTGKNTASNVNSRFNYLFRLEGGKYELVEELKKITKSRTPEGVKKEANSDLSERETAILKLVVSGLTNQEIADKLFLSIHTITTHRKNITRKLGIKTVSGLTVYALMNNILDLSEIKQR